MIGKNMNLNPIQSGNPVNQAAQGLAGLGRNNDSMLMHVTPNEVQGLQGLAQALGGSLTTNPQTGLPEAGFFDGIGDFIGNLLPSLAGTAIGYGTGNPFLGATIAGGLKTAQTGDLGSGILAGIGAYSGAGTMGDIAKMGTPATALPALDAGKTATGALIGGEGAGSTMLGGSDIASAATSTPVGQGGLGFGNAYADLTQPVADVATTGGSFGDFATGLGKLAEPGGFSQFVTQTGSTPLGAGFKLASPFLGAGMETMMQQDALPDIGGVGGDTWNKASDPLSIARKRNRMQLGYNFADGGQVPQQYGVTNQQGITALPIGQAAKPFDTFTGYNAPTSEPASSAPEYNSVASGLSSQYAEGGETVVDLDAPTGLSTLGFNPNASLQDILRSGGIKPIDYISALSINLGDKFNQAPDAYYNTLMERINRDFPTTQLAKGGYLDGPGDGMSDSIPATIEGKQPARLADGEFVVPADVVSHLGNGSTKAGSQRLYGMLDKVRKARTGTTKQGKQINPDKYLPV